MPETETALADFVVQLDVEAIAVVTVRAGTAEAACAIAERDLRPVDVVELRGVEAAIVSGPHPPIAAGGARILRRGAQTAPAGLA